MFIVTDIMFRAMCQQTFGWPKYVKDLKKDSKLLPRRGEAEEFAEWLAEKQFPGQKFFVFEMDAVVIKERLSSIVTWTKDK